MKSSDPQTPTHDSKRKPVLSPDLQELMHMLDALEARFQERLSGLQ